MSDRVCEHPSDPVRDTAVPPVHRPDDLGGSGGGHEAAQARRTDRWGISARSRASSLGSGTPCRPPCGWRRSWPTGPRFTFDGRANFLDPDRRQSVSADLAALSGILAPVFPSKKEGIGLRGAFVVMARRLCGERG